MAMKNEIMTVEELAKYLRVPRSTVYRLAQRGRVPSQKVGRHWRFRKEAIDRWLEAAATAPGEPAEGSTE